MKKVHAQKTEDEPDVKKLFPFVFFLEKTTPVLGKKSTPGTETHATATKHEGVPDWKEEEDSYLNFIKKNTTQFVPIEECGDSPEQTVLEKIDKLFFLRSLAYSSTKNHEAKKIIEHMIHDLAEYEDLLSFVDYMKTENIGSFLKNPQLAQEIICIYNILQVYAIENDYINTFEKVDLKNVMYELKKGSTKTSKNKPARKKTQKINCGHKNQQPQEKSGVWGKKKNKNYHLAKKSLLF